MEGESNRIRVVVSPPHHLYFPNLASGSGKQSVAIREQKVNQAQNVKERSGAFSRLSTAAPEDMEAVAAQTVPVGRLGKPEELANLVTYMCSDYASWLNGAIIDFDGGQQFLNHGSSFGSHLHEMSSEDWEQIENSIRQRTGKAKSKM
ncbi:hypothetical protein Y032_0016g3055 [Ancylostoma ceylanicum]|nr:hypothetical protein Y032_0016g3055 [Ancylostoma ceylanicum]